MEYKYVMYVNKSCLLHIRTWQDMVSNLHLVPNYVLPKKTRGSFLNCSSLNQHAGNQSPYCTCFEQGRGRTSNQSFNSFAS